MRQKQGQIKQANVIKANLKLGSNQSINKINYSKSILSNVGKEEQINDLPINSPTSTPYRNYKQSTLRSEQLSTPEQTTLNLSTSHNQNGISSGTFYGGINTSINNTSKYNLENVRNEYFQNTGQNQSSSQQKFYSPKVTAYKQDSCASISTRKSNIVPPLRLNKVQHSQINNIESVESFDIGHAAGAILNSSNQKAYKSDQNTLSFLYLSSLDRMPSTQKPRAENNNSQVLVNGFMTDRTNSCSNEHMNKVQLSKGILKQKENQNYQKTLSKSKERSDGIQVIQSQVINNSEWYLQQPKLKNEIPKIYSQQSDNQHESQLDQSRLEFKCMTERRLSSRPSVIRTANQFQSRKRSQETAIHNGYLSPIGSVSQLNNFQQEQLCASNTTQKHNQTVKFNETTLPLERSGEILMQRQNSSFNNIPTISQYVLKKKFNQQSQNQPLQQQQPPQIQLQNSINKQYQSTTHSQQKYLAQQSSSSKREILNLKKTDSKLIQFFKNPLLSSITNPITSEQVQNFSSEAKENKNWDGLIMKCKTEGDLYQQVISPRTQNVVPYLKKNEQGSIQEENNDVKISENKNHSPDQNQISSQTVPNLEIPSNKKGINGILTAMKFQQKQTQKLNILQEFIQKQSQVKINRRLSTIGLNVKNQGDLIEFWKDLKSKVYAKNNVELVFKKNRFDQKCLTAFMEVVDKINKLCSQDISSPGIYNSYIDTLQKLTDLLLPNLQYSSFFLIRLLTIQGKFSLKCGNIYNALKSFFAAKHFVNQTNDYAFKIRLHKYLGQCFKLLKDFRKAKSQYVKMLILSWLLNNKDSELQSYDELGIIFYYECEIPLAQRLHQRLCLDITEDQDSKLRQSAVENFKQRKRFNDQQKNMEISTQAGDIKEMNKKSNKNSIKELPNDIEDFHISDSSDEEQDYYVREIVQRDIHKQELQEDEKMQLEKRENSLKNIKLRYSKLSQERELSREQDQIYQRILGSQKFSENTETERKKKNPAILISHLSRNRSSNNYKETSVKEYQYFHLKKFQQQLQPDMNQQQYEQVTTLLNQISSTFKKNSILRSNDEQTPASLVNFNNVEYHTQANEDDNANHTLFRFDVSSQTLKCLTSSLEKLKKQIIFLLSSIEKYEAQQSNLNSLSKRNALIFH